MCVLKAVSVRTPSIPYKSTHFLYSVQMVAILVIFEIINSYTVPFYCSISLYNGTWQNNFINKAHATSLYDKQYKINTFSS